ncbi:MAG TPA: hypothetical protein RMH85_05015 [Polyangiaceae bacterium LLY-WYZ-15_(1-7)]|nr:hypothetical protein [Sandaracinus sp.]HJL04778.1 hypothetical protein [Polyangiaceae bacterium LLY-WYZ-15_(1-7)]HJL07832.1 hypothetical protein [Polyangiaceae bacterium LLY-WYZ-15_(1-7)]HJL34788.1 hypothetical protein [Polyangiaceae bacterium LLY-WYZ-15_(1-7)]HJL47222.1 hypothetical protein [Polyangiaceae bacterium LLY-WYZ-15_(1-7)]
MTTLRRTMTISLALGLPLAFAGCGGSAPAESRSAAPAAQDSVTGGEATTSVTAEESADAQPAGMAPSSSEPSPMISGSGAGEEWDALLAAEADLGEAFETATVDCDVARDLRDQICDLSGRICAIADETPDPSTAERCRDGEARCDSARDRVDDRC